MAETATALKLVDQDLREEDLLECLSIAPGHAGNELVGHTRALDIWKSLIRSPSFTGVVIINDVPGADPRVVGFGASVFVQPKFADEELSTPRTGLNSRVLASIDGGKSVVLTDSELRLGNARGSLDSLILYGSWRYDVLSREGVHEVCSRLGEAYMKRHRGFNINRLIKESVGEEERSALGASRVWRAIRHYDESLKCARTLWVITQADSSAVTANIINPLFIHKRAILGLRDADQKLLTAALDGLTDEELASRLGLTLNAVKKRWISVFARTTDLRPDLFPASGLNGNQTRGRQKRHHVLAYVRSHWEELRPMAECATPAVRLQRERL